MSHNNNSKPCDCRFCSQFYFMRMKTRKYNYDKNSKSNQLINSLNNDNNNNFTLKDLDNVSSLKSQNLNTEEISQKTNLTYDIVNNILKIINYKK